MDTSHTSFYAGYKILGSDYSKERVDERSNAGAGEENQRSEKQQRRENRCQQPFLVCRIKLQNSGRMPVSNSVFPQHSSDMSASQRDLLSIRGLPQHLFATRQSFLCKGPFTTARPSRAEIYERDS